MVVISDVFNLNNCLNFLFKFKLLLNLVKQIIKHVAAKLHVCVHKLEIREITALKQENINCDECTR